VIFIGVDPGKEGAVAVLNADGCIEELRDMVEVETGLAVEPLIPHAYFACVEAQHAFPKIAASTNFKMGLGLGFWRGVFKALAIPYEEVAASKWQRLICGALPKEKRQRKRAIAEWAHRRWPTAELFGPKGGLRDGRSDALCIAEYARRQLAPVAAEGSDDGE